MAPAPSGPATERRRLRPRNWPVRWRLAATSAGLTLIILLVFGAVIGKVATNRIRDDFNREVRGAAQTLAAEIRIVYTPLGTVIHESRASTTSSAPTTPRCASTTSTAT